MIRLPTEVERLQTHQRKLDRAVRVCNAASIAWGLLAGTVIVCVLVAACGGLAGLFWRAFLWGAGY